MSIASNASVNALIESLTSALRLTSLLSLSCLPFGGCAALQPSYSTNSWGRESDRKGSLLYFTDSVDCIRWLPKVTDRFVMTSVKPHEMLFYTEASLMIQKNIYSTVKQNSLKCQWSINELKMSWQQLLHPPHLPTLLSLVDLINFWPWAWWISANCADKWRTFLFRILSLRNWHFVFFLLLVKENYKLQLCALF